MTACKQCEASLDRAMSDTLPEVSWGSVAVKAIIYEGRHYHHRSAPITFAKVDSLG